MRKNDLKYLFGRRLKNIRQNSGFTQSILAEQTGISEEYLSKLERGLASPSFGVITKLCQTLGTHPMELFRFATDGSSKESEETPAEAEMILGAMFETLPFGVFAATPSGRFRMASPAFAKILGYAGHEDMFQHVSNISSDIYLSATERDRVFKLLPSNGEPRILATTLRCKDGKGLEVRLNLRRVVSSRNSTFLLGVIENVMGKLCVPGMDQEWVHPIAVRDLHHRIKNNFSMVKSYIELCMGKPELAPCNNAFMDIGAKIMAVSKVHEALYRGDLFFLDVNAYLSDIIPPLAEGLSPKNGVMVKVEAPSERLGWEKALPLGIAAVELVTNAIKYAYPNGHGSVNLSLRRMGTDYVLCVEDGGVGYLPNEALNGFGMTLVQAMAERLEGTLSMDTSAGTSVTIRFPAH